MVDDKEHLFDKDEYQRQIKKEMAKLNSQQFANAGPGGLGPEITTTGLKTNIEPIADQFLGVGFAVQDYGTIGFVTQNIDFDFLGAQYNKFNLNGDVTFGFLNFPLNRAQVFTVDITIDTVTPPVIIWPSSVKNLPINLPTADGSRYILHMVGYRNDIEEVYHVVGGSTGSIIPAGTAENDHLEWDNAGLKWDAQQFLEMGGAPASTGIIRITNTLSIDWDNTGVGATSMFVDAADIFFIQNNGNTHVSFADGDYQFNGVTGVSTLQLINRDTGIIDLDQVAEIKFVADDQTTGGFQATTYGRILVNADDVNPTASLDGRMTFFVMRDGSSESFMAFNTTGNNNIDINKRIDMNNNEIANTAGIFTQNDGLDDIGTSTLPYNQIFNDGIRFINNTTITAAQPMIGLIGGNMTFNVSTGFSFDWKVEDVQSMFLTSGALQLDAPVSLFKMVGGTNEFSIAELGSSLGVQFAQSAAQEFVFKGTNDTILQMLGNGGTDANRIEFNSTTKTAADEVARIGWVAHTDTDVDFDVAKIEVENQVPTLGTRSGKMRLAVSDNGTENDSFIILDGFFSTVDMFKKLDMNTNEITDVDFMIFNERGGDPTVGANQGVIYVKDVGGNSRLFFDNNTEAPVELGAGSAAALNDLTDVVITTPADNEVLAFDSGSGDWINQTAAEANLVTTNTTQTISGLKTFSANVSINSGNQLNMDGGTAQTYITEDAADNLEFHVDTTDFFEFFAAEGDTNPIIRFESDGTFVFVPDGHEITTQGGSLDFGVEQTTHAFIFKVDVSATPENTVRIEDDLFRIEGDAFQSLEMFSDTNASNGSSIAELVFFMNNSGGSKVNYAAIAGIVHNASTVLGDREGALHFLVTHGASNSAIYVIEGGESNTTSKLGWYDKATNPAVQQQLDATPTLAEISTVLRNYGLTKL